MSTKPEAGQWWVNDTSGDKVYFIGRCASGIMVFQVDGDEVEHGDLDWSGWHHARCDEPDQPQPAEDPDEWVEITDPDHVLRSCDFFQIADLSWHRIASSVGKTVASCRYFTKAIRCRRRDLPKEPEPHPESELDKMKRQSEHRERRLKALTRKVKNLRKAMAAYMNAQRAEIWEARNEMFPDTRKPQPQKPVSDESLELIVHLRDQMQVLANRVAECERVVFTQKPQPQKTRVRLWATQDGIVWMDNDALIPECWRGLHHDSEGFYVENQQ